jgi:hypothetical protein
MCTWFSHTLQLTSMSTKRAPDRAASSTAPGACGQGPRDLPTAARRCLCLFAGAVVLAMVFGMDVTRLAEWREAELRHEGRSEAWFLDWGSAWQTPGAHSATYDSAAASPWLPPDAIVLIAMGTRFSDPVRPLVLACVQARRSRRNAHGLQLYECSPKAHSVTCARREAASRRPQWRVAPRSVTWAPSPEQL